MRRELELLEVISLEDARRIVEERFCLKSSASETVNLSRACGRRIAHDVFAAEGVPAFDRSSMDGYAVVASDTFGCSDALPALLTLVGEVEMGASPACECASGTCVRIPTGGMLPQGADAVTMLEHCEDYGDGTIGIAKPAAPGDNVVYKYDDVKPGQLLIPAGTKLAPHHIGTLASLGMTEIEVSSPLRVAVISTGDEIVDAGQVPVASQMRDVNAPVLASAVEACGAVVQRFPIIPDDYDALHAAIGEALATCDMVLVSGGSSAGQKDNTARVLSSYGSMLFHGIAIKPGKPTMCVDADGKPAFGLPGHPVAAYFLFLELVRPLLTDAAPATVAAKLGAAIPSNHGRAEFVAVKLADEGGVLVARPVRGKSGLISQLSMADGYIEVRRNQEGLAAGAEVSVKLF